MGWSEDRVEAISKAYCNAQDGDEWDKQPAYYRKQTRRIVRAILTLAEDADRLDPEQERRWAEYFDGRCDP